MSAAMERFLYVHKPCCDKKTEKNRTEQKNCAFKARDGVLNASSSI